MHPLFSDWYHATSIDVDDEELKKRWRGVDSYAKKLNLEQALDLIRVFNGKLPKVSDFNERFGSVIQKADSTFRVRKNEVEMRLLAGSTIIRALAEGASKLNDALALAVTCATCRGLVSNDSGMNQDVIDAAKSYLLQEAVRVRSPNQIEFSDTPNEKIIASIEQFKEAFTQAPLATVKDTLANPLKLLTEEISTQTESLERFEYELKIQREELNITWWVIGEYSRDLDKAFSNLKLPEACLIAAKELADLTEEMPGPRSAPALLDKVLKFVTPNLPASVSLKDAVNGAPEGWRTNWKSVKLMKSVEDFCHVHLAVQKSIETGGGDWVKSFNFSAPIKASQKFLPLDLAVQTYQEDLLIRAANDQ